MISKKFYMDIGLNEKQIQALTKAMDNESRFKDLLRRAGVMPSVIDKVTAQSDTSIIDEIGEVALIEIIKDEWAGFISDKKKG